MSPSNANGAFGAWQVNLGASGFTNAGSGHVANLLAFTQACQLLAALLLLVAIIMCIVHRSLMHDAFHQGIISAIKLYR